MGGLKSRSFAVPVVLGCMYAASLAAMALWVVGTGEGAPGGGAAAAALGAGLAGILGLGCFYRGLAIGTMSIVAPIAATGVSVPVLVGLLTGDSPSTVTSAGLGLAVVGIVLASREDDGGAQTARQRRVSIALALAAGLGFGSYFVGAAVASEESVAWALLLSRVSAGPLVIGAALLMVRRGAVRPTRGQLGLLLGIGLLDLGANALYNAATTQGALSSVAVAASLYPVVTVLLAATVLGERVRGVQGAGVVLALGGVALIAGG